MSEGHAAEGHTAKEFIPSHLPSHLPSHTVGHTAQEFIPSNLPSCGESIRQGAYRYDVEAVQDRWKEADWFGGKVVDKTVYRIVAGAGLYELHKIGAEWRLGAIAD